MPPRTARIEVISARDRFFLGDDQDDGKGIRIKSTKFQVDKGIFMSTPSTFALALTEKCCEAGKGKVLCNVRQDLDGKVLPPSIIAANALLPDLLYIPHTWTKSEQTEYLSLKHHTRLALLNAQSDLISVPWALPIQLITQFPFTSSPTDPLSSLTTKRSAVLFHLPDTYFGFAETFRSTTGKAKLLRKDPTEYLPRLSDDAFDEYRQRSGDALVNSLEQMYQEGVPPKYSWEIERENQTEAERKAVAQKDMLLSRPENAVVMYARHAARTREMEEHAALHPAVGTCLEYQAAVGEAKDVLEAIVKYLAGEDGADDESGLERGNLTEYVL